ncbi:hypothetical protein ACVW1A_008399 [Bradyrhizobium sp. LB1.3]
MTIVTIQVTREGTTPGAASLTAEEKAASPRHPDRMNHAPSCTRG